MALFLRDFTDQLLQWKRQHFFSRTYNLRAEDQVLATLNRAGSKHAKASAEEHQWLFKREGQRKFLIYPGGTQLTNEPVQPLAEYQINGKWNRNGNLTFHDGRIYTWTYHGTWHHTWSWQDSAEQTLLTVKKNRMLEVAPDASDSPDLALLALFGLYLLLMMEQDEAALVAATISVH